MNTNFERNFFVKFKCHVSALSAVINKLWHEVFFNILRIPFIDLLFSVSSHYDKCAWNYLSEFKNYIKNIITAIVHWKYVRPFYFFILHIFLLLHFLLFLFFSSFLLFTVLLGTWTIMSLHSCLTFLALSNFFSFRYLS